MLEGSGQSEMRKESRVVPGESIGVSIHPWGETDSNGAAALPGSCCESPSSHWSATFLLSCLPPALRVSEEGLKLRTVCQLTEHLHLPLRTFFSAKL